MNKILIFSLDTEFCESMNLWFEQTYRVRTVSDFCLLDELIKNESFEVLLADSIHAEEKLLGNLANLKKFHPELPVILLHAYKPSNIEFEQKINQMVKVLLYKPVDPVKLSVVIEEILKENKLFQLEK